MLRAFVRFSGLPFGGLRSYSSKSFFPSRQTLQTPITSRWARWLLLTLSIKVEVKREIPSSGLIVANHISWVDIFVINSAFNCRFVAKFEIASWPLIGYLCKKTGTVFIERGKRNDALRVIQQVQNALQEGDRVAFFPEGTTTSGKFIKPFHSSLFQSVVNSNTPVVPVALRYKTATGKETDAAVYIDDMSLMESINRLIHSEPLVAEVHLCETIIPLHDNRQYLAQLSEKSIADIIQPPQDAWVDDLQLNKSVLFPNKTP